MLKPKHQVLSVKPVETNYLLQREQQRFADQVLNESLEQELPDLDFDQDNFPIFLPFAAQIVINDQLAPLDCLVAITGKDEFDLTWSVHLGFPERCKADMNDWQVACYQQLHQLLIQAANQELGLGLELEDLYIRDMMLGEADA